MFDFEVLVIRFLMMILQGVHDEYSLENEAVDHLRKNALDFLENKRREAHYATDSGSPTYMRYNPKKEKEG